MRGLVVVVALSMLVVVAQPPGVADAVTETEDTIGIIKEGVAPTNSEISVRLSESTPLTDTSTVVVARDDRFADALASGVLQGTAPMLLVPRSGPVPERVLGELRRLAPSRVIILGGTQAVGQDVEDQIAALGVTVERRAGDTRFTTATTIAGVDVPDATTAILARAFPAPGSSDDTQAFADTLGVGAWSAEEEWPVMLTDSLELTASTRTYLVDSAITDIKLIGGTAAISTSVEEELTGLGFDVERIAGDDRFGTAIEIAGKRGAESAADAASVLIVDSQFDNAWAGGLAAAAHAAFFDAPIVLTSGGVLPPSSAAFLAPGTNGQSATPVTCVAFPAACEQARVAVGLPAAATFTTSTPDGSVVAPGQQVTVTLDAGGRTISGVTADGTCLPGPVSPGDSDIVTVTLADPLPAVSCTLRIDFVVATAGFAGAGQLAQSEIFTFTTFVPNPTGGLSVVASGPQLDARQLASNLVGEDVQVFNATLTSASQGAGLFAGGGTVIGFDQGIVLSTGMITDVVGPNDDPGTSGVHDAPGDPELTALSGNETLDAVVLEFDFVAAPDAGTVAFEYVFGSEEYEDFVGSPFNDVFAFFVNGSNCALVAGGPVSVNTVNPGSNAGFYRSNEPDPSTGVAPVDVELDGLTTVLPCQAPINAGGTNHLKLAIADASDPILDSAVFIRAASFVVGAAQPVP